MLRVSTSPDENDIVLDFFSGSGTTGHAVMELNKEDGGNRRFILVQLPELTKSKDYPTIAEMGKARLRSAGKKLSETDGQLSLMESASLDTGFKVFKLDSSNLKVWDSTPVAAENLLSLASRMNGMIDQVKSERSDMDVVYEIMLKLGVPLTYSVSKIDIAGKVAYSVGDDCLLLICLAPDITPEIVEQMAEYAPAKIILAEHGFADDTALSNAHYILQDRSIALVLV